MDSALPARVRAQFEAILFEPALGEVENAFGPYGAIAAQSFESLLAQTLEHADAQP